jgi:hypothetical protein
MAVALSSLLAVAVPVPIDSSVRVPYRIETRIAGIAGRSRMTNDFWTGHMQSRHLEALK